MGEIVTLRTPEAQVVHGLIAAKVCAQSVSDRAIEARVERGSDRSLFLKMALNAAEDAVSHLRAAQAAQEAIEARGQPQSQGA